MKWWQKRDPIWDSPRKVLKVATFVPLSETAIGVTKCDQNLQWWVQLLHVKLLQKQMNKKSNLVADIWFYHYVQNEVAMMSCSSYRKCLVLFCRGVGSIVIINYQNITTKIWDNYACHWTGLHWKTGMERNGSNVSAARVCSTAAKAPGLLTLAM